MKRITCLLVCALICSMQMFSQTIEEVNYYLNNPDLGGDAVILNLLDLSGNTIYTAINNTLLDSGDYSYTLPEVKNDVYLVQLIIDGRVNVKKVFNQ